MTMLPDQTHPRARRAAVVIGGITYTALVRRLSPQLARVVFVDPPRGHVEVPVPCTRVYCADVVRRALAFGEATPGVPQVQRTRRKMPITFSDAGLEELDELCASDKLSRGEVIEKLVAAERARRRAGG